jgi:HPr kinase/phosphorylase
MRSKLTIGQFYQQYKESLSLSFISSKVGLESEINISSTAAESFEAIDYLNVIRPSSVVLIGHQESKYIRTLKEKRQYKLFSLLFAGHADLILFSHIETLDQHLIDYVEEHNVPILNSDLSDAPLLESCRYYLSRALAKHTVEHGVFIEVHSVGIFIRGNSGIGKSELALALISRGHRLISDDVTQFTQIGPKVLDGHSPGILTDFMEVRGLGIVNIRAMFGSNSVKRNKTLRLVIKLSKYTDANKHEFERLGIEVQTHKILGIEFPEINLPIASGRNIAVLVETAARNHLLNMNGYHAAEDFIERQRQAIRENT